MEKINWFQRFKSERAFTLVEVLAVLALLSMILIIAGSIQYFSHKQSQDQKVEIQKQTNNRLAANLLTKDIRRANDVTVISGQEFIIKSADNSEDKYIFKDKILYKNDQPLITDLVTFQIIKNTAEKSVSLTIDNLPTTKIYIRK